MLGDESDCTQRNERRRLARQEATQASQLQQLACRAHTVAETEIRALIGHPRGSVYSGCDEFSVLKCPTPFVDEPDGM
jgi:hypothetical protein